VTLDEVLVGLMVTCVIVSLYGIGMMLLMIVGYMVVSTVAIAMAYWGLVIGACIGICVCYYRGLYGRIDDLLE